MCGFGRRIVVQAFPVSCPGSVPSRGSQGGTKKKFLATGGARSEGPHARSFIRARLGAPDAPVARQRGRDAGGARALARVLRGARSGRGTVAVPRHEGGRGSSAAGKRAASCAVCIRRRIGPESGVRSQVTGVGIRSARLRAVEPPTSEAAGRAGVSAQELVIRRDACRRGSASEPRRVAYRHLPHPDASVGCRGQESGVRSQRARSEARDRGHGAGGPRLRGTPHGRVGARRSLSRDQWAIRC